MNRKEHLLCIAAEECAEVAQRISKALRFGLSEVQPGQPFTNATRIVQEYVDLVSVIRMLEDSGAILLPGAKRMAVLIDDKQHKVERFLNYSQECGTLTTSTETT